MLLKYFMEWVSWLAWDEGSTGKECGKAAEGLPETVLSRRGTVYSKGNLVIFIVWKHCKNSTIMKGSTRRRCGRWNHLDRSPEQEDIDD